MLYLLSLILLATVSAIEAQVHFPPGEGWQMHERYQAFRFEIPSHPTLELEQLAILLRDHANLLSSFGWCQLPNQSEKKLVGEFRGVKSSAMTFRKLLHDLHVPISFLEYSPPLISQHFHKFVILDRERTTCFKEPPHACAS